MRSTAVFHSDSTESRCVHVAPQKAAVEHFESADGKDGVTVDCEDTFGNSHTLQHRFWTNVRDAVVHGSLLGTCLTKLRPLKWTIWQF